MNKYFIALGIVIFIILLFALTPDYYIKSFDFKFADKVKHILAFFTLSFFFYKSFEKLNTRYKLLILFTFAVLLEVVQSFVGREASFIDILASLFGILIYLFMTFTIKKYQSKK